MDVVETDIIIVASRTIMINLEMYASSGFPKL